MTNMRINYLRLENFKCHTLLELRPEGCGMAVFGDNAAGKTSIYDAFAWLLFGKDSQGNGEKNIDIKPLDENGAVADHSAITAVEAELLVNGEKVTLKRTYREVWATKRGSSQESFEGNTSEYYVDGVPCKKNAFDDRIRELVPEDTFRMLTSVSCFARDTTWQKRREVLFAMAGTMTDKDIMSEATQFADLLEGMGKLSLEDYKKKLLAEKRGFVGAKTDIPARISECQKTVEDLSGLDFAKAKAEIDALTSRKESLEAQLLAIEHDTVLERKRMEIREAKLELTALENENMAFRASQGAPLMNVRSLSNQLTSLTIKRSRLMDEYNRESELISGKEQMIADARAAWISVNGESFSGGTCGTCGQVLPADKLQQAQDAFDAQKRSRLRDIEERANFYKTAKEQAEDRLMRLQEEMQNMETEIQAKKLEIAAAEGNVVEIQDMDGYAERKAEIAARIDILSLELAKMAENAIAVKGELTKQIAGIKLNIAEHQRIIGKESLLDYSEKRIEQLREEGRNAAACLEAIEKMLFLMDEYVRYKTRVVENGVNSMFRIARFRLFREQANGGVEDRCDVVVDGVPYNSLNNGMKINVGIDIINALSRHYGVLVPLFVDNAESVTNLEKADAQVIRLVVSAEDKKLRCVYENP